MLTHNTIILHGKRDTKSTYIMITTFYEVCTGEETASNTSYNNWSFFVFPNTNLRQYIYSHSLKKSQIILSLDSNAMNFSMYISPRFITLKTFRILPFYNTIS